jgi:small subunit ribosomal protein S17
MAEETPENIVEEVASAGEAGRDDERSEAGAATEQPAPTETETEAPAAAPGATRKERNAAARAAKAKQASGPRTLEERLEERRLHRERNAAQRRRYRAKRKEKRAATRAAAPAADERHAPEHGPGRPKVRQGVVTSDKGEKTITVRVDITRRHKRYHKILRSSITLHVHDENNGAHTGDTVRVQECRPMSRTKRWRLLEVLERAR